MKLIDDWLKVVKKAWSIRLMILAAFLSGLETILPYFSDKIPTGVFAIASFVITAFALLARIIAQPKMDSDEQG